MIKSNIILKCKEVSFKFNFDYGDYNKWVDTAKIFNKNEECCNNYRILIDEDSIVLYMYDNI